MKMRMKNQQQRMLLKETTLKIGTCTEMMNKFLSVLRDMRRG